MSEFWLSAVLAVSFLPGLIVTPGQELQGSNKAKELNYIPHFRSVNDCGRIAVFSFANILGEASMESVIERVSIDGPKGSSLVTMSECLNNFGIAHGMRWVKPENLCRLKTPAIIRMRNVDEQFHYLVIVHYDRSLDKFGILDGERDEVVLVEGKRMRLRSTGFVIEPASGTRVGFFPVVWIVFVFVAFFSLVVDRKPKITHAPGGKAAMFGRTPKLIDPSTS